MPFYTSTGFLIAHVKEDVMRGKMEGELQEVSANLKTNLPKVVFLDQH
jgi:hypothetical protein